MPFDRYQRYRMVADVIERLREGSGPLRILDVGGEEDDLSAFLPGDTVTVLDLPAAEGAFEDEAFDYAVSVHAYGRVEPEGRERHLSVLRRTATRGVLLASPFDSAAVRGARRVAGEFHRAVRPAEDAPSSEPAAEGLPELEDVRRFFEEQGDAVSVLPNGYLPHWLAMTCLASHGPELDAEMGEVFREVNAFYNEFLYGLDNAEPSYRHLLVSLKEPASVDLDRLASPGPDPEHASLSSALFGAFAAVLPLAAEVRRLNVDLARREGALARKEAQVNDLSRRLAERLAAERLPRGLPANEPRQIPGQPQKNAAGQPQQDHDALQLDVVQLRQNRDELQRQLTAVTNSRGWRVLTVLHKIRLRISGSG